MCPSRWTRWCGIIRFWAPRRRNELEVLLVAVKSEIIEGLFRVGEAAGLRIKLVDVSSAALCNAFRYNYGDVEGCSMLLDIGAKTSNLLFFEKGKVYARSINIGANSITQDFGHEAKLRFAEAEAVKLEKGSVSLGGAYEEPEDPQAAAIAKIARQVMTRLHIQVNQTIQFYRGQQGGSAPERLYLVRRGFDHALHGAVFCGETQFAGGLLQSVPEHRNRPGAGFGGIVQVRAFVWGGGGIGIEGPGALPGGVELDAQKLDSAAGVRPEKAVSDRRDFQPGPGGLSAAP
jgi:hypothetical protein